MAYGLDSEILVFIKIMDLLTREEIRKVAELAGDEKFEYVIEPASDKPIGFLGIHYRLRVSYDNAEKFYFIKTIPTDNPNQYEYVVGSGAFDKEVESHQLLFKEVNKAATKGTSWHPKYYYSRSDIIVLEDLSVKGFKLIPNKQPIDYDHAKLALKTIAAMHGQSLTLEQKISKEIVALFPLAVKEIVYNETEPDNMFTKWMDIAVPQISNAIADVIEGYSDDDRNVIRQKLPGILREAFTLTKPSKRFKNIFNHGDLWINNILFRYENGKPTEACLVDYQMSRYLPPAHDVMDIFYLTTTREFRLCHEKDLIKFYYDQLALVVQKNGFFLTDLIPWEIFLESCNYYRKFALIRAGIMLNTIIAPSEVVEKGFETNEEYEKFTLYERGYYIKLCFQYESYKKRISEIFHEIIDEYVMLPPERK